MHRLVRSLLVLCAFISVSLTGCYTKRPFHLADRVPPISLEPPPHWEDQEFQKPHHDPKEPSSAAVIEFDEDGHLWNCEPQGEKPNYCELDRALDFIRNARRSGTGREVVVVTFVHGWHHNANAYSENFQNFQRMIRCLNWGNPGNDNQFEGKLEQPAICTGMRADPSKLYVGVYVGWRGESVSPRLSFLKYLSVLNRRAAAARVAANPNEDGLQHTFLRISEAAKTGLHLPPAKLVIVGHSFGGLIVTRTTASILEQRMALPMDQTSCDRSQPLVPPFADVVIAINPADDALRMADLMARIKARDGKTFCPGGERLRSLPRPLLISMHTSSDSATDALGSFGLKLAFWVDRSEAKAMSSSWNKRPGLDTFLDDPPSVGTLRRTTINHEVYLRNTCYLDQPDGQDLVCLGLNDVIHDQKRDAYRSVMKDEPNPEPTPLNPNYARDPYYHGAYELLTAVCAYDWEVNHRLWNKDHQFKADFKVDFLCSDEHRRELRDRLRNALIDVLGPYLAFPDEKDGLKDDLLLDVYRRLDTGTLSCGALDLDENGIAKPRPCKPKEDKDRFASEIPWNDTSVWTVNTSYEILQSHSGLWNTDVFAIITGVAAQYPVVDFDESYRKLPLPVPAASFTAYRNPPRMERYRHHWAWPWQEG